MTMTTNQGAPLPDNQHSLSAGERGPLLLQDHQLLEKLAHFVRERVPERVVHAKGAGAFGYFEVTHDLSRHTKAAFLGRVGLRTPVVTRFSTVGGEKGSADAERDPRGFAVKFYTAEGTYDLVGNNTPVFFIRDPFKFPDMVHTHKRDPQTNLKQPGAFWDFFSHSPESTHMVTILFSDRGIPKSHRHMHGFGSHTFKWVNRVGQAVWVKYHFKTEAGVQNLGAEDAQRLCGSDPDHATRDLHSHIAGGQVAAWRVFVQIMPFAEAGSYRYDPFDVTKVWRYRDYPLQPLGRLVLDRNPANVFVDIEQAAFSPSNFVPGIEASPDKLLQGRIFSYPDAQRYRLGANFAQLAVNRPHQPVHNHQRDGAMRVAGADEGAVNYSPNSFGGPPVDPSANESTFPVDGQAARTAYPQTGRADDFEQAGVLYRLMPADQQERLIANLASHLRQADQSIQLRQLGHFQAADATYGARVAAALGLTLPPR